MNERMPHILLQVGIGREIDLQIGREQLLDCLGFGMAHGDLNQPGFPRTDLEILIIENDPAAARLTKEAFKEAGLANIIKSVSDGDQALAYLRAEEAYAARKHPHLIFLDLHLPKKSGLEVLAEIKSTPSLASTPVVVVSGAANPSEIRRAYQLHASCYVRKPDNLDEFLRFIKICYEFWGTVATFATPEV